MDLINNGNQGVEPISSVMNLTDITEMEELHNNPQIQQLYKEFLGKPLSKKSHKLLHTKYKKHPTCKE